MFGSRSAVANAVDEATTEAVGLQRLDVQLEICDLINGSEDGCKEAVKTLRRKLGSKPPMGVTLRCLVLLEACVKNCHRRFHVQIATKDFMDTLVHVLDQPGQSGMVREKLLSLIQTWADAFSGDPALAVVVETYRSLQARGVEFPAMNLDEMAPVHTPTQTHAVVPVPRRDTVEEDAALARRLAQEDQPRGAYRIMELLPGQRVVADPTQMAKLRHELHIAQEHAVMLRTAALSGQPSSALRGVCEAMRDRAASLIETLINEDLLAETLGVLDILNGALEVDQAAVARSQGDGGPQYQSDQHHQQHHQQYQQPPSAAGWGAAPPGYALNQSSSSDVADLSFPMPPGTSSHLARPTHAPPTVPAPAYYGAAYPSSSSSVPAASPYGATPYDPSQAHLQHQYQQQYQQQQYQQQQYAPPPSSSTAFVLPPDPSTNIPPPATTTVWPAPPSHAPAPASANSAFDPFGPISPTANAAITVAFPPPSASNPLSLSQSSSSSMPASVGVGGVGSNSAPSASLGASHISSTSSETDIFAQTRTMYQEHLSHNQNNAYVAPHAQHSSLAKTVFTNPYAVPEYSENASEASPLLTAAAPPPAQPASVAFPAHSAAPPLHPSSDSYTSPSHYAQSPAHAASSYPVSYGQPVPAPFPAHAAAAAAGSPSLVAPLSSMSSPAPVPPPAVHNPPSDALSQLHLAPNPDTATLPASNAPASPARAADGAAAPTSSADVVLDLPSVPKQAPLIQRRPVNMDAVRSRMEAENDELFAL